MRDLAARILGPAYALAIAVLIGNLLILLNEQSPADVWGLLLASTWGSGYGIGQVLFKAVPLALAGFSVALAFRAGLFNVGAEGQMQLGALACAVAAAYLPASVPGFLALPWAIAAAVAAGAALGALPGWLRARFGAHEVITTIMLNFVVAGVCGYALSAGLAEPESLHTKAILPQTQIPRLGAWISALHGSAASWAILIVAAVALAYRWFFARTRLGLELRAVGLSETAAEATGVSVSRARVLAMTLAGGVAALSATSTVLGYKHAYELGFGAGAGFMGIAVALLGQGHPAGIVVASLVLGTLSQGGLAINALVPKDLVDVMQATIILVVVASSSVLHDRVRALRAARRSSPSLPPKPGEVS